jgi:hypothetical protein
LYILIFVIILAKRYTSLVANETQINEHQ